MIHSLHFILLCFLLLLYTVRYGISCPFKSWNACHLRRRTQSVFICYKSQERQTSKDGTSTSCRFRISSEGLPLLLPYITKQVLLAPLLDFKHLLQYKSIKFGDLVDSDLKEKTSAIELGCCVVVLKEGLSVLLSSHFLKSIHCDGHCLQLISLYSSLCSCHCLQLTCCRLFLSKLIRPQ